MPHVGNCRTDTGDFSQASADVCLPEDWPGGAAQLVLSTRSPALYGKIEKILEIVTAKNDRPAPDPKQSDLTLAFLLANQG